MSNNDNQKLINFDDMLSAFKSDEFTEEASEAPDLNKMSPINRRKFLALAGASTALAATACTDYRDKGQIITYNKKPESVTYGKANYYASTYRDGSPILIKTREGRPIAIVGNSEHPVSKGKSTNKAHSAILDLYDPDRLKSPQKSGKPITWKKADEEINNSLKKVTNAAGHIAIICSDIQSPTFAKMLEDIKLKWGNVGVYPMGMFNDHHRREAWKLCYSTEGSYPAVKWDKASIIVALEADILGHEGRVIEQVRGYSQNRNIDEPEKFNRLYAVEGNMSLTGTNADYRLRLNPLMMFDFLAAIYNELVEKLSPMGFSQFGNYSIDKVASENGLNRKTLNTLLNDLMSNGGKSILYAGDAMPHSIHILVNIINEMIGAVELYDYSARSLKFAESIEKYELERFITKMNSGEVSTAIVMDSNPAYFLPEDYGFKSAFSKVRTKICLTEKLNETSDLCDYVLPINHPFESWGDFQDRTGIVNLRQPVIEPLYDTRQAEAVLLAWSYGSATAYNFDIYHKYLKNYWFSQVLPWLNAGSDFEKLWFASLHDGFAEFESTTVAQDKLNPALISNLKPLPKPSGITVLLTNNHFVGDGRYAGNGWLQETPHPVSKAVWDNYAAIAPATAEKMGLDYKDFKSDLIELSIGKRKLTVPVILQPGMAENVVALELGYGRTNAGVIGTDVGVNAVLLMSKNAEISEFVYTSASIKKLNEKYSLFSSQEHHKLEDEFVKDFHRTRQIIQDGTVAQFIAQPDLIQKNRLLDDKQIEEHSVNPPHDYSDVKWAMAIDLNRCTSCSNCVVSCNVENNIPIVGKDQCGRGREMQWIRLDRYYSGTSEEPVVSNMPMLCQHCDMAPCENVCPVAATTHSPDGLNQMTYNRCVGTRYCANNCPYKVRRYNFYNFRDNLADGFYEQDSLELLHNPEVTVRSRGVMEKCTFCVQRLSEGKQESTNAGEKFTGKGLKTACQEACPAEAIVFGNVNDPNSDISRLVKHNLGYKVLEVLGVKPNVTYLAKLRNTNAEEEL